MKKTIAAYVAASLLAIAMPAAAASHAQAHASAQCEKECNMQVRNCSQDSDTLQGKISRLEREIAKGSAAYTADELQKMELKLKDTQDTLEKLTQRT